MNRGGTFERALKLCWHLCSGHELSSSDVRAITGVSRAQANRYMLELERVLPVRALHADGSETTHRRVLMLERDS